MTILLSFASLSADFHIIGDDSREQVFDSSELYYKSIGKVTSGCSGTLISKRHVLTAAHCIYSTEKRKFYTGHGFIPGATQKKTYPYGAYNWRKVFLLKDYIKSKKNSVSIDYALIELEKEVVSYDETLIEFIDAQKLLDDTFDKVSITGYPADKASNTLWVDKCNSKNRDESKLSYICDSTKGMSGSAILYHRENGQNLLLAVNSGGMTVTGHAGDLRIFNQGAKITSAVYSQIKSWMDGSHGEETHIQHNKHTSYKFIISSNCQDGIELYTAQVQDEALTEDSFTLVDKNSPLTVTSNTKDIYVRANIVGEKFYFGSKKYYVTIDSIQEPAYKVSIKSGLYGSMLYTLNCESNTN